MDGEWISLVGYASRHSVSLSTLRRRIKKGDIDFKKSNGRYLIWDKSDNRANLTMTLAANNCNEKLHEQIKKYQEEINDLKMLLSIYESELGIEKTNNNGLPPEIPKEV